MTDLEKAKELINEYCQYEFKHDADFSNMENIGIAYTTITDDELDAQVSIDLVHMQIIYEVYERNLKKREDITLDDLKNLEFDYLISECVDLLDESEVYWNDEKYKRSYSKI